MDFLDNNIFIIGYSGHAYVCIDVFDSQGISFKGYLDRSEKKDNPYDLEYLGCEIEYCLKKENVNLFIGIGDNKIRNRVYDSLPNNKIEWYNGISKFSVISSKVKLGKGILIAHSVTINPLVEIGNGVICNTACIIEHECQIGDFAHIAPGATLAGNVRIGQRSFIGANSVIKQGVKIGDDVIVGAGTVIIKDIPNGVTVVGNPSRILKIK